MLNSSDEIGLAPWAPSERENFFDAITRHQNATWRVTAACSLAALVVFMVFPVLLAPFFFSAALIAFDVLNRFMAMPDLAPQALTLLNMVFELVSSFVKFFDPKSGGLGTVGEFFGLHGQAAKRAVNLPLSVSLPVLGMALLPGIVLLLLAWLAVRRALSLSPLFDTDIDIGRLPNASNIAEQRLRNTIEEMAIAASLPAPRVRMIEGGNNAAVVGRDSHRATVLVGSALIENLNREQIQALSAQLVSSIANGDLGIGFYTASTLGLFALVSRTGTGFLDRKTALRTYKLILAVLLPTKAKASFVLTELAEPLDNASATEVSNAQPLDSPKANKMFAALKSFWALMLFPLFLGGLVVGLLSSVALSSAIAYLWRQRKYMMDATAVRLTRNPDSLVAALDACGSLAAPLKQAAWATHMHILNPGMSDDSGIVKNAAIAFPSTDARQKALVTMGAKNRGLQRHVFSFKEISLFALAAVLLLFAAGLLVVAVVGMMAMGLIGATAISGLPAYVLHLILR